MEKQFEGVILSVVPYQDRHEIANVFTPFGKISVIRKWGRSAKKSPLSPLTRAEFFVSGGRGELFEVKEYRLIDPYLKLRDDLEAMRAAASLLKALKLTQEGEAPSELLYRLLLKILSKISDFPKKNNLVTLFFLKLLLHEGLCPLEALDLEMAELAPVRSFEKLASLDFSESFHKKVHTLFLESVA